MNPAAVAAAPQQAPASLWDRLSGLRLRLRDTVGVDRLSYRGRPWYLLRDALSGQQFRLSQAVYDVVAALDGRRTLAQVWAQLSEMPDGSAQRQEELCSVLLQLQGAGMLDSGAVGDAQALIARQRRQRPLGELGQVARVQLRPVHEQ